MENKVSEFESILESEERILDDLVVSQSALRKAVTDKNWENLTKVINKINTLSNDFMDVDAKRETVQDSMKITELKPYFERLG